MISFKSQVEPYPKHIIEVICTKYTVARAYMNNAIKVLLLTTRWPKFGDHYRLQRYRFQSLCNTLISYRLFQVMSIFFFFFLFLVQVDFFLSKSYVGAIDGTGTDEVTCAFPFTAKIRLSTVSWKKLFKVDLLLGNT